MAKREANKPSLMQRIMEGFQAAGVEPAPRPTSKGQNIDPRLPEDLTELTDEALGKLHGEFAAMAQFVTFPLAIKTVESAVSKHHENLVKAKVKLEKSGTIDDKKAKTDIDPRSIEAAEAKLVAEGVESLTSAIMNGYLIGRDACSRELTRRQKIWDAEHGRR